jgi:hypothetical protein
MMVILSVKRKGKIVKPDEKFDKWGINKDAPCSSTGHFLSNKSALHI